MLNKVLPAQPAEFVVDLRKEFSNLAVIQFHFLYPVDQVKKLFFANLFPSGDHLPFKSLAGHFLKGLDLVGFTGVEDGNGDPAFPRSPGSSTAMDVNLQIVR